MKNLIRHIFAAGLAVAVIGAGLAATQPTFADVVKDRRAEMKKIGKANKALKNAVKANRKAAARRQARNLVASIDRVAAAGMWPRGTDRKALGAKATRAKPLIWRKWGTFEKRFATMRKTASAVAGGNMAAAKNIGKSCGGCHKHYRAKKGKRKK